MQETCTCGSVRGARGNPRPYRDLGEVVIIGGWAHRLYRIHPVALEIAYARSGPSTRTSPFPRG